MEFYGLNLIGKALEVVIRAPIALSLSISR